MKRNVIFTLAKKEFFGYINSVLAYVITVPFLLISTFIYMRTSLVYGEASLRPFFELLPWYLLFLAPALSMKLLTDEQQANTIELLLAHPISEFEIVFAKFLGAFVFFLVILATTFGLPLSLILFSNPDIGIIAAQYIGAAFVGATFLSIGLASSSYVKNAIGSFLLAASISFGFLLLGLDFVSLMFPWPLNRIISEIAILTHMENIARGLLDIRDIFYFITITGFFLTITILKLSQRKTKEDKAEQRKLNLALGLIAGIGIALNILLAYYPMRLDLTQAKQFTLSKGTKQTIKNLPDTLIITLFASRTLPAPLQSTLQSTQDILKDYSRLGNKVTIKTLNPDSDTQAANEAQSSGVQKVTFNQIGASKFEVQTGYLGLTIRYGDKTESIPFIQDTADLEYQLTRRIRKLTQTKEQTIALFNPTFRPYSSLQETLKTQYNIKSVKLDKEDELSDIQAMLVIDDGSEEKATSSAVLAQYLANGGKVLALVNGVTINPQTLSGTKSKSKIREAFSGLGIDVDTNLIYDLQLNETLSFGQGNIRYLSPYPYWLKALPKSQDFPPLSGIKSITLAWPSSLNITKKDGVNQKILLVSSKAAGKEEGSFNLSPQNINKLPNALGKQIPLAVMAEKGNTKLVLIGNSNMATDEFARNNKTNSAFIANTIDWLAAEGDLAAIPAKKGGSPVLAFTSPIQIVLYQYGNILIPPILVGAFAIFYLSRRKKLSRRQYRDKQN